MRGGESSIGEGEGWKSPGTAHLVLMANWNFTIGTYGVVELHILYLWHTGTSHIVLMANWNITSCTDGVLELQIWYLWSTGTAHLVIMD